MIFTYNDAADITIGLNADITAELIEAVIDTDDFGEVIGVEVIGLLGLHPEWSIGAVEDGFQVSIDRQADAVYFRLRQGRSSRQQNGIAAVILQDRRIVGLRMKVYDAL